MSGLVKPKKYDWKDSNLELFGSPLEREVKKAGASGEAEWVEVGKIDHPEMCIWRIEKFKVKPWPKEDYGKFYGGDSYIILKITKDPDGDELLFDVHFWIGKHSSQDEYGTAAYKTVELDTFLDDRAIQHREVQGSESKLFKSYFPVITVLKGGCASGFRHVNPVEYKPRLLHFHGKGIRHIEVKEVRLAKGSLDSSDVFILDNGLRAYQWNGKESNKDEKFKAAQYLQQLESERNGRCVTEAVEEKDVDEAHSFMKLLPDLQKKEKKQKDQADANFQPCVFKLSDESGKLSFAKVAEGKFPKSALGEEDAYVIDNGRDLYVYVGKGASGNEKKNAMVYAHNYLQKTLHPFISVTCLRSGQKNADFEESFTA